MSQEPRAPFNPSDHLIGVQGGQPYLQVKHRLMWLHEVEKHVSIETEIVQSTPQLAVVKATLTVTKEDGSVSVYTAHKSAAVGKFPPLEKAETGAVGRALALAGFGTQWAGSDVDERLDDGGMADSPGDRPRGPRGPQPPQAPPYDDGQGNLLAPEVNGDPSHDQRVLKALVTDTRSIKLFLQAVEYVNGLNWGGDPEIAAIIQERMAAIEAAKIARQAQQEGQATNG